MGRFNLLEEPWVVVMTDNKGATKEVSLKELFANAQNYKRLAGETSAQDFAILRLLLAILHTVFSRFDGEGNPYEWLDLDEKYRQISELDEDDQDEYQEALLKSWETLWEKKHFPTIVADYLEKWSDHFYLYDEKHPFYQVNKPIGDSKKKSGKETGVVEAKLINRLISESDNKMELFSPYNEQYKNRLTDSGLARWLITFQGYTGTSGKNKYPTKNKYTAGKGWLLGIGGIYLSGTSLLDTLLLNLMMVPHGEQHQIPVWEKMIDLMIEDLLNPFPDNLAELYANCSRMLWIDPKTDLRLQDVIIKEVQLPGIDPQNFFLEPMTLWQYPKTGDNRNHFIPKLHNENRSFWRSFGLVVGFSDKESAKTRKPDIVEWYNKLSNEKKIDGNRTKLVAVGMNFKSGPSNILTGEIYDELNIQDQVLADLTESGWVKRIFEEVTLSQKVIDQTLRYFARDIRDIRNLKSEGFINTVVQDAYFAIDLPFREWLSGIELNDEKEKKVEQWRKKLKELILEQANHLLKTAGNRDYLGREISKNGKTTYKNIEISYNKFVSQLYQDINL